MVIKLLDEDSLAGWVDGLLRNETVIGPVQKGKVFVFDVLEKASDLRMDYDMTMLPPKKYLLPAREVLVTFRDDEYQSVFDVEPFILFGVHPWDMAAISQMDRFFMGDHKDEHYAARREACTIVVMDPQSVFSENFAGDMGTAVSKEGGDLLLSKVKGGYLAEARTRKGEELLKSMGKAENAGAEQLKEREALWESNRKAFRKHPLKGTPAELPGLLKRNYDNPIWKEKAALCLSCGACNVVCPTCYCFDVQDEPEWEPNCASRCRLWDGCQLKDFAAVAGGHNFRRNSAERYRHRFYHKAEYLPEETGEVACVGCGRCITACVPKVANPVEVFNKLWEG